MVTYKNDNKIINNLMDNESNKQDEEYDILKCPICDEYLTYLMPFGGAYLYCKKCEKYFKNDNGKVGSETSRPYTKDDTIY